MNASISDLDKLEATKESLRSESVANLRMSLMKLMSGLKSKVLVLDELGLDALEDQCALADFSRHLLKESDAQNFDSLSSSLDSAWSSMKALSIESVEAMEVSYREWVRRESLLSEALTSAESELKSLKESFNVCPLCGMPRSEDNAPHCS